MLSQVTTRVYSGRFSGMYPGRITRKHPGCHKGCTQQSVTRVYLLGCAQVRHQGVPTRMYSGASPGCTYEDVLRCVTRVYLLGCAQVRHQGVPQSNQLQRPYSRPPTSPGQTEVVWLGRTQVEAPPGLLLELPRQLLPQAVLGGGGASVHGRGVGEKPRPPSPVRHVRQHVS